MTGSTVAAGHVEVAHSYSSSRARSVARRCASPRGTEVVHPGLVEDDVGHLGDGRPPRPGCDRRVRIAPASSGSGFQNVTSLTQYASTFDLRCAKPNASNISIVRQAMPSAWPSRSGPGLASATHTEMSGNAASWAARVSPVGPEPTMSTSTSVGSGRSGAVGESAASASAMVGSPARNPFRWNCTTSPAARCAARGRRRCACRPPSRRGRGGWSPSRPTPGR